MDIDNYSVNNDYLVKMKRKITRIVGIKQKIKEESSKCIFMQ